MRLVAMRARSLVTDHGNIHAVIVNGIWYTATSHGNRYAAMNYEYLFSRLWGLQHREPTHSQQQLAPTTLKANLTFAAPQLPVMQDIDEHSLADLRILSKELEIIKQR